MAAILRTRGRSFIRLVNNLTALCRDINYHQCSRSLIKKSLNGNLHVLNVRCLATENIQQKLHQDVEFTSSNASHQKLDKALYQLDMDVRRTGRIALHDVEQIFNEIKVIGNPSSTQCLLLIRCCGSLLQEEVPAARIRLVTDIWNTLRSLETILDVSHYNALLKVYLENEYKFSPTEFLTEMQMKNIEPNRVTYQRLISRYCQEGDIVGASKILEFMKEKAIPINEYVFNSLIQGHTRAKDMENAKAILEVMRNAKLDPTSNTYTKLLCGYAELGDIDGIREVLKEAESVDISLSDREYLELIYSLAVSGHSQYVDEIIEKLRKAFGYNQDAVNTIYQLVNSGQEDVAYKLILTLTRMLSATGEPAPTGQFFIRQLVKVGAPKENIISIVDDLKKRDRNPVGLVRATEAALFFEKIDYAIAFMEKMKEQNFPIRPHYFWPILCTHRKAKNENGIYETLEIMMKLDASANFDTFLDFVFPAISVKDPETVIQKLKNLGHSVGSIVNPLVTYFVVQRDLSTAVHLLHNFPTRLSGSSLINPLAQNYHESNDLNNVLEILVKLMSAQESNQRTDWVGEFLLSYLKIFKSNCDGLETLLQGMKSRNLCFSHASADFARNQLKSDISENVVTLLEDLSSSSLQFSPSALESSGILPHPREMNIEELESHYIEMKSKGMNTRGLLRRLLFQHCRFKNLGRAMEIKGELDECQFIYTPAMYAQLMELHVAHKLLNEALEFQRLMHESDPNFGVDDHKIINLAALLLANDRAEDAVKLIKEHYQRFGAREKPEFLLMNVWRLLNSAAEKGNVPLTKDLFELLRTVGAAAPVNTILGPLVKVHLVNDDIDGALQEFEHCCKAYRSTPWKNELFLRLIRKEDPEKLQKVVDLSTEIHGEMNTMYDLAFAFIDCNQMKQARKILETPGLRARHQRLNSMCEKYIEVGKVKELEQLVAVTRDLFDIDRDLMYYNLLRAYAKIGDVDRALEVWTSLQEENINPSDRTLRFLADFLKEQGREVPFVVPPNRSLPSDPLNNANNFETLIEKEDVDGALEYKRNLQSEGKSLEINQMSALIEVLVRQERLSEALNVTKEMLMKQTVPSQKVLRFLLLKLGAAGDVANINFIGDHLTETLKQAIKFNNLRANAYVSSDRGVELLESLERESSYNKTTVAVSGILSLLNSYPNLQDRVQSVAEKYATNSILGPLNMVWMYHFLRNDYDKAAEIYASQPGFQEKLMFRNIIKEAKLNQNEIMARKLVDVLTASKLSFKSKGLGYCCLMDIQIEKDDLDGAVNTLKQASELGLAKTDFVDVTLSRLQFKLEQAGKPFPLGLVNEQYSSSSSDSESSDDEKK